MRDSLASSSSEPRDRGEIDLLHLGGALGEDTLSLEAMARRYAALHEQEAAR